MMMKRFLLGVIGILFIQSLFAEIPAGYYDTATGTGYTLKTQLYNIIDGHTQVSYSPGVWDAFYTTDVRADGYVWDTYSNCDFTFGDDQDSGSGGTDECQYYNREHSFPRSWFGGEVDPMNTDLFHIMPTDKYVNKQRGSYEYGEVTSPTEVFDNGSKIGPNTYGSYTGTVFEPIDEYKGDFARNYFYMATRYENVISTWPGCEMLDGSNDQCFSEWALDMLIEWHNNDSVSQKELDRNDAIYAIQNNRNPFIDHPEYVTQIWGGNSVPSITDISITLTSPTSSDPVSVSATITDSDGTISSAELHWGTSSGSLTNTITMSVTSGDTYVTNTDIPVQANGTIVYYEIEATDNDAGTYTTSEQNYTVNDVSPGDTIFEEDFETVIENQPVSINGWAIYNEAGTESWEGRSYNSNKYAQMSAYNTGEASNISWLITPAIDLTSISSATFSFISKDGYNNGDVLEVLISTNYSGTGDPNSSNWINLNPTVAAGAPSDAYASNFTESGDIDITSYCGNTIYIAYKYTGGDGSITTTMQVDDVLITGEESSNSIPSITDISNTPVTPTEEEDVTISATITDSDGTITSAIIKWGTESGSYPNTETMTNSGDTYSGVIPAQTGGASIHYVIEATDNDAGSNRSDENSFIFSVITNELPEITNITNTPANPVETEDVTVSATIIDSDGTITATKIKWGTASGDYSNTDTMTYTGSDNIYSGIILAQAGGTTIHYLIEATDNDSDSNRSDENSFTFNSEGNEVPQITGISMNPTNPQSDDSVTVSATITDSDGTISSAIIKWGTISGTYNNTVSMSNTGDTYSGVIPAQADETHVYFVVYAVDNDGGSTQSPENDYLVTNPNVLPVISNVSYSPTSPESTENVNVSATITDSDGAILTAKIKWGTTSGNYLNEVSMSSDNDNYTGVIPSQADETQVYFIIECKDNEDGVSVSSELSYIVEDPVNQTPVISDVLISPTNPTDNDTVIVSAVVNDPDGTVETVILKWKRGAGANNDVSMNLSGGKYYGQIPKQETGDTIYFSIVATDNEGLQGGYTDGSYIVSESNSITDITGISAKIFPNPTNNKVQIEINGSDEINSVFVYNLIGEKVFEINNLSTSNYTIELGQFKSGIYILQVKSLQNNIVRKVMLK